MLRRAAGKQAPPPRASAADRRAAAATAAPAPPRAPAVLQHPASAAELSSVLLRRAAAAPPALPRTPPPQLQLQSSVALAGGVLHAATVALPGAGVDDCAALRVWLPGPHLGPPPPPGGLPVLLIFDSQLAAAHAGANAWAKVAAVAAEDVAAGRALPFAIVALGGAARPLRALRHAADAHDGDERAAPLAAAAVMASEAVGVDDNDEELSSVVLPALQRAFGLSADRRRCAPEGGLTLGAIAPHGAAADKHACGTLQAEHVGVALLERCCCADAA